MTTPIKILVGLLAVAVIGLVFALNMGGPDEHLLPDETNREQEPAKDTPKPPPLVGDKTKGNDPETTDPIRVKAPSQSTSSGANYDQGVTGMIVDPYGGPVADAKVYLMPGMGIESLKMFKLHQEGVRFPPLAHDVTGPNGTFKLGIKDWKEGKEYEVRILHETYCDLKLPNVRPQPNDWADFGKITLKTGVAVYGRVTNESGSPVPGAKIVARDGSGGLNIVPAPGREEGIVTETNESGDFEITNLDPVQIFALTATAQNFAKEEKRDLHLTEGSRHQVDFQLVPGEDIAGTVVDAKGNFVARAKVTVAGLSQKSQLMEVTRTDEAGYFLASGLKRGVYAVMVEAEGFLKADEKPVQAGQTDLTITLETTGMVIVTVLNKNGGPQRNYRCNLKAVFEGKDNYGNPLVTKQAKNASDGTVKISGVKPLKYVAEVFAPGHAKNFSEPFVIVEGQEEPPRVTVQLDEGGIIHGFVMDSNGEPVAGVEVSTMPNGLVENPFTKMFQVPYTITKQRLKTTAQGEFKFKMLYSGRYQLKFDDERFCSYVHPDVDVKRGDTTTVGDVKLDRGCQVSGIASLDGVPAGQIKVNVSAVTDARKPIAFSCEAITDNEGRFLLPKPLPPGKYTAMAAQNVQANPLMMMVQYNKSKKQFTVSPGQETKVLDVQLQSLK